MAEVEKPLEQVWADLDEELAPISDQIRNVEDDAQTTADILEQTGEQEDLLAEKTAEEPENSEPEEPEKAEDTEPSEEPDQAEKPDYDQEVEVPLPNEQPMTVGQLKDAYLQFRNRETNMQRREAEIASEYGKLAQLDMEMRVNNGPLRPEQVEQVKQVHAMRVQRESEMMLDAIPEFKDAATLQSYREDMVRIMAPFGISEQEIAGTIDHRRIMFYKSHVDLVRRVEAAEKLAKEPQKVVQHPRAQRVSRRGQSQRKADLVKQAMSSDATEAQRFAGMDALLE